MDIETKEEWKSLEGFSNYLFSNMGNIKRISDGRIEKVTETGRPKYYYVHLVPDGGERSLYRLHRLIAQAWITKPDDPKIKYVDHINRDKFDNRVENLRWVCRSGNQRNRDIAYFAVYKGFWVHVRTFYKDNTPAYAFAYKNRALSDDLEELETLRNQPAHQKTVDWEGETYLLIDLCRQFGKDYEKVFNRYKTSNNIYSAMIYEENPRVSYELEGDGGVLYQFSNMQEIVDYLQVPKVRVQENIEKCQGSLVKLKGLINDHVPAERRTLYTINGTSKFRDEWISFYETSEVRVSCNMTKLNLKFEEAVQLPIQRVRKVDVSGKVMYVKDMWLHFGLDPKRANNYKAEYQTTFKQTLERLGVDVSNIEIIPL